MICVWCVLKNNLGQGKGIQEEGFCCVMCACIVSDAWALTSMARHACWFCWLQLTKHGFGWMVSCDNVMSR
jgi:hypothetical protein